MDLPESLKAIMEAGLRRRSLLPTTPATRSISPGSQLSDDSPIPIDPQLLPSNNDNTFMDGFGGSLETNASPVSEVAEQESCTTVDELQPRFFSEKRAFREDDEDEDEPDNVYANNGHEDEPISTAGQSNTGTRLAQQMARKFDFNEALTEDVVSFAKLRPLEQNVKLYCLMADVWRKAKEAEDSWMPSGQALDNIREICKGVMLSPSTPCYMGPILLDMVLAIINQREIGLPIGYQSVPSKVRAVNSFIRLYCTNVRADMKKLVVKSTKLPFGEANVENLTNALYRRSAMGLQPTIESWGRVAVMRSVYNQGVLANKYWDAITSVYETARKKAKEMYPFPGQTSERAMAVSDQIRAILEDDYVKYGNPLSSINAREPPSRRNLITEPFQDLVDDIIALPHSELQGLAKDAMRKFPASAAKKKQRTN